MLAAFGPTEALTAFGVIVGLGTAAVAIYLAGSRKEVNEASAAESLSTAAMALIEPQRVEIASLQERLAREEQKSRYQDEAIKKLQEEHGECLDRESRLRLRVASLEATYLRRENGGD
jgi:hypothetical protein